MGLEPERPIEKLLRDCAKRRAEEARTDFEMHPATRKLLQSEVARHFGKGEPKRKSVADLLAGFGPRFAWTVGAVAAVIVLMTVFLPKKEPAVPDYALLALPESPAPEASTALVAKQ